MASVAMMIPMSEGSTSEDYSWQDVYAAYGCSTEFDVSDDDG